MSGLVHRQATLAGGLFLVLLLAGTLLAPSSPDFVEGDGGVIADYFSAHTNPLLMSRTLYLLGGAALLWFGAAIATRLRDQRVAAATVLVSSGAAATALFASAGATVVATLRADEAGSIDPAVATVLFDLGNAFYGIAAPAAAAALVLALAVTALHGTSVARWAGAVGAVLGLALLTPPISHIAIIVFTFFPLVAGLSVEAAVPATQGVPADSSLDLDRR